MDIVSSEDAGVPPFIDDASPTVVDEAKDDAVDEVASIDYRIVVANQQMLISLFNLLSRGHAETGGLASIDDNRAIVSLSMQIKNRSVFVLTVPVDQGKSRIVGAFGWGIADIWYAAEGTAELFDLFWYVLPEHRGRGSVDLLQHAIQQARQRFPDASIRIDNINASVDKGTLERLYGQLGLTKIGSVYRVA